MARTLEDGAVGNKMRARPNRVGPRDTQCGVAQMVPQVTDLACKHVPHRAPAEAWAGCRSARARRLRELRPGNLGRGTSAGELRPGNFGRGTSAGELRPGNFGQGAGPEGA